MVERSTRADGENYYFYGPDHHPFAQKNIATGTTTYLHADNSCNQQSNGHKKH